MNDMERLLEELARRFGATNPLQVKMNQYYVSVPSAQAVAALTQLKTLEGFGHLSFFTCVDYLEEDRFELLYLLHSYTRGTDLGVRVSIPRTLPVQMEGIHHLWAAGETYQRELREMYGIEFPGSPRLHDDFALEGWQEMPPMRRDFDTKEYSLRTFEARPGRAKIDNREHMKKELYPSEAETW
ncbi:MAG: NADH-quinone oxidoreductase subunit C [Spirochaetales bacterium]